MLDLLLALSIDIGPLLRRDVVAENGSATQPGCARSISAAPIAEVVVNPSWNAPATIAAKELWPKQRRDPSYFAREHMVVSNGRIRQEPGPWNALGRLKFNMPNRHNVYRHDTTAKSLFEQTLRAFSHGCIRLEKPRELALHLLRDQPQRTAAMIESETESGKEGTIPLTTPRPVYVIYWTPGSATTDTWSFTATTTSAIRRSPRR